MKTYSACTYDCPDACSFIVEKGDGGEISIKGAKEHPVTRGVVCKKGKEWPKRLASPERITTPLLRNGERFERISWDAALDLCAEKIQPLLREPARIFHFRGHGYRGVLAKASDRFFEHLGAGALCGSLCDDTGIEACLRDFGELHHNDIADLGNASGIVNWGKDLSRSSLHMGMFVQDARKHGATALTISPGGDGNGPFTDQHIWIRPGTDRFLALAAIKRLQANGEIDPEILKHTANWDAFSQLLDAWSETALLEACDVSGRALDLLVEYYSRSEPVASILGWGMQRYLYGGQNIRAVNALALLSGNIGRSGGGAYYNVSSARNLGKWRVDPSAPEKKQWLAPLYDLPGSIAAAAPPVEFAWVDGHNIVNQVPGATAMSTVFSEIPFTVVVDAFMNDTARRADLILPCALCYEKEDLIGSCMHNAVNYVGKVVDAPGEARDDFSIISDLAGRLTPAIDFPSAEECLRKGLDLPHLNASLEDIRQSGFVMAEHAAIAFEGLRFGHADGFHFLEKVDEEPALDAEFPLRLLTLVRRNFIHSQIPEAPQGAAPEVFVAENNPLLQRVGEDGDAVMISPLGRLEVRLKGCAELYPNTVIIRRGGWLKNQQCANGLLTSLTTDMGEGAALYSQFVRLEEKA